jgi:hypothetical protein
MPPALSFGALPPPPATNLRFPRIFTTAAYAGQIAIRIPDREGLDLDPH